VTHIKQQKSFNHVKGSGYNKNCLFIHDLDVIKGIFAVLYVSNMGFTHCYKTVVFLRLSHLEESATLTKD